LVCFYYLFIGIKKYEEAQNEEEKEARTKKGIE
jgi:hypothetical protein